MYQIWYNTCIISQRGSSGFSRSRIGRNDILRTGSCRSLIPVPSLSHGLTLPWIFFLPYWNDRLGEQVPYKMHVYIIANSWGKVGSSPTLFAALFHRSRPLLPVMQSLWINSLRYLIYFTSELPYRFISRPRSRHGQGRLRRFRKIPCTAMVRKTMSPP